MPTVLDHLADLVVEALDRVRRIDNLPYFDGEGEEGGEPLPGPFPHRDRGGVALAHGGVGEGQQRDLGGLQGGRGVDLLELGDHRLTVLVGHELHRRPDEVHGAGLHGGVRPDRLDRLG